MPQYLNNLPTLWPFYPDEFDEAVRHAIEAFAKYDFYLISNDLHEAAMTHRIAIYLDELFPEYNVDCEWNKNLMAPKAIFVDDLVSSIRKTIRDWRGSPSKAEGGSEFVEQLREVEKLLSDNERIDSIDSSGDSLLKLSNRDGNGKSIMKRVRPDIIIHHRGTNENMAVIEAKKKNAGGSNYPAAKGFDLVKLYAMTTQSHLNYRYGFYIEIPESGNCGWSRISISESGFLTYLFGVKANRVFEISFF